MTHARGKAAEQIRSAVGREERAVAWGDYIASVLGGALTKAAGRCGVGRTRMTDAVSGKTGFRISDVPALEEEHGVAILEMLAEVLGYRVVKLGGTGDARSHVDAVQAAAEAIGRITGAASDGSYSRQEASELRPVIKRAQEHLEAVDRQLVEAEVHGVRRIA